MGGKRVVLCLCCKKRPRYNSSAYLCHPYYCLEKEERGGYDDKAQIEAREREQEALIANFVANRAVKR